MTSRAAALLDRVARGEDDGVAVNELIGEYYRGYPIETLLPLLRSADNEVVQSAAWLAQELSTHVVPLLPALATLLDHADPAVRFWTVSAIRGAGRTSGGEVSAKAANALHDPDLGVRWMTMRFLSRTERERLVSMADHSKGSPMQHLLTWLIHSDAAGDVDEIIRWLGNADAVHRLIATIAATRLASRDPRALAHAAQLSDDEVSTFAREALEDEEWRAKRRQGLRQRGAT